MKTRIGLEIHVELNTKSKMFCSCGTAFGLPAGSQCCPVCLGLPGALPTVNAEAVHLGALAGFAFHSHVNSVSRFDRKQYFYPDLPKGYQITQRFFPLCTGGNITLPDTMKKIRIIEMHLEEDAGKLIHKEDASYVNLNRCGVPLLEIVTAPDFSSGDEVYLFLHILRDTLVCLDITTGKMQEGALRVDVNVSVSKEDMTYGERTEMKNLSSFKAVRAAIAYEADRQIKAIQDGEIILPETRRWDEKGGFSEPLREKAGKQDYRYFPEPDLPPLALESSLIEAWHKQIPDTLPEATLCRIYSLPGMTEKYAFFLANSAVLLSIFDAAFHEIHDAKRILSWLMGDYRAIAKKYALNPDVPPFSPQEFALLMKEMVAAELPYKSVKEKLEELCFNR
ncbi:MAG: Asp-tRNA(Asn)/Glu-tRNA(Gln) amidotransferase subunit GatB [Clostridiales bacterium]|nr:Asp-tRNA(Asn)/Glu-tRNA(Gln) amidotransferase subunit GatB [Clostridiales bacterium]